MRDDIQTSYGRTTQYVHVRPVDNSSERVIQHSAREKEFVQEGNAAQMPGSIQ